MKTTPKIVLLPFLLLLPIGCASPGNTQPEPDNTRQRLEEARRLYQGGQLDEALEITDALLQKQPKLREARELAADANLALAASGRRQAQFFVQDAIRNLKRACRGDAGDADIYLKISSAYLQLGKYGTPDWQAGRNSALTAAAFYTKENAGTDKVGEAVLLAARHELEIFKEARRSELQDDQQSLGAGTMEKANTVMARLEKAKQTGTEATRGEAYILAAVTWQWMNRNLEAIHELERGLAVAPDYLPLHAQFQQLHIRMGRQAECAAVYRRLIKEHGKTPGLLHGVALSEAALADARRRARDFEQAAAAYRAAYDACEECLQAAGPELQQYYTDWKAIIRLSLSDLYLESGDIDAAKREAFLAYDATPRVLETDADGYPLLRGYGGASYLLCIEKVGGALVSSRDGASLRAGLDFWEEAIARHPDKFGWFYNNAGLCARDLGSSIANPRGREPKDREQALKDAMAMWERSYAHYKKAAALSPDDPRIVNDCALMLVYHLKRDYDDALRLLQQAILTGKRQLAALPEDADRQERQNLEEAIGDAYQNTAVMYQNQGKPYADYEGLLKEAVKYYPYQFRQAARMLRNPQSGQPAGMRTLRRTPDPRVAEFQKVLAEASKKAEDKDFDGALLVLDNVKRRMQGHPPYHYYMGLYSLRYAQKSMAAGGSGTQISALLADARVQLQKAVQLNGDPVEPRLYLAEANLESGELVNAAKISESLLSHIASMGGTDKELHAKALALRARAGARIYEASRQQGKEDKAELTAARNAFRALEQMDRLDKQLANDWSDLEARAGNKDEAVAIVARAASRTPQDQDVLRRLLDLARSNKTSGLAAAALADRKDAVGLWYLGLAHYDHALQLSAAGKEKESECLAALAKSTAAFLKSMQANEAFTDGCKARIARCMGAEGYVHLRAKRFARAEVAFLAAAKERPDRVTAALDDVDSTRTVRRGLIRLIEYHYTKEDLASAERVSRHASELLPGDADFANNHGLLARDYGVALEAAGDKKAALAMWEASLTSYQRAVSLEPDNLRLINDLALMQIYHLHRDLPKAKMALRQCIQAGEKRLKKNPPKDERALRDLQETIGDCHQNLGYCLMVHDKDYAAARPHFEASLKYYPFDKRDSKKHLERLDELTGKKQ